MLRVTTTPRLMLSYQLRPGAISGGDHQSHFVLTLSNDGPVSAQQAYVLVRPGTTLHAIGPGSKQFEEFQLAYASKRGFQALANFSIHPGHEVPAVSFLLHTTRVDNDAYLRLDASTRDFVLWRNCGSVQIAGAIGSPNTAARNIEFEILQDELEVMAETIVLKRKAYIATRRF